MTSIASAITGGGSLKAAGAQAGAAEQALQTSKQQFAISMQMTKEAMAHQMDMLDKALAVSDPYVKAGNNAMAMYESLLYGIPVEQTPTVKIAEYQQKIAEEEAIARKTLPDGLKENGENKYIGGGYHYRVNQDGSIDTLRTESHETWMPYRPEFTPSEPPPDTFVSHDQMGQFDPMDVVKETPGYNFRRAEGQKAVERSAAAKSGILSGAQLKATERYGQDFATSEFDNYLNRLAGLINTGANAASGQASGILGSAGTQANLATNNMGNIQNALGNQASAQMQIGAAKASGYLGQQAAGTNLLNTAASFAGGYL